jgi:membrane-associated phospholipid phosphatase
VICLGVAAAVVLWLRSRSILLPIALLAALAATESLVTILKIALDRPRPPASLVVGVPLSDDAFPSGHTFRVVDVTGRRHGLTSWTGVTA